MGVNSIEVFEKNLSIYHKIIENNLMFHRTIETLLSDILSNFPPKINMLDLGCSDGYFYQKIISKFEIQHYWGYDLSPHSIEIARKNNCQNNVSFLVDNIVHFNAELPLCHFIFAGYVIHHLSVEDKTNLLIKIKNQLAPKGKFLMVDIFKPEHQTLQEYYQHYWTIIQHYPEQITTEERDIIYKHLSNNDFPESIEFWQKIISNLDLGIVENHFFKAPHGYILFERL